MSSLCATYGPLRHSQSSGICRRWTHCSGRAVILTNQAVQTPFFGAQKSLLPWMILAVMAGLLSCCIARS